MFSSEREYDASGKEVTWMEQMKRIPAGSDLFTVMGLTAPPGHEDSKWVKVATVTLTTELQTSLFGDQRMFFSHIAREDDNPFMPVSWWKYDNAIDPVFNNHLPENQWTVGVPEMDSEGGWPSDEAGAKAMFMD